VPVSGAAIGIGRSYGPPQSDREIRQFVARMRETLNDDKLDIIWNPTFRLVAGGTYTATGELVPPVHEGRWQVTRRIGAGEGRDGKDDIVLCTVRAYTLMAGILAFEADEDAGYAPVDERLLVLLRSADSANVRQFEELRKRIWAADDAIDAAGDRINEGEAIAGLDHAHFKTNYAGGVGNWKGRGVDLDAAGKIVTP